MQRCLGSENWAVSWSLHAGLTGSIHRQVSFKADCLLWILYNRRGIIDCSESNGKLLNVSTCQEYHEQPNKSWDWLVCPEKRYTTNSNLTWNLSSKNTIKWRRRNQFSFKQKLLVKQTNNPESSNCVPVDVFPNTNLTDLPLLLVTMPPSSFRLRGLCHLLSLRSRAKEGGDVKWQLDFASFLHFSPVLGHKCLFKSWNRQIILLEKRNNVYYHDRNMWNKWFLKNIQSPLVF